MDAGTNELVTVDDAVMCFCESSGYTAALADSIAHELRVLHRAVPSVWPDAAHAVAAIGRLVKSGRLHRDSEGLITPIRREMPSSSAQRSLF